jgi:diguanylate cyclase (GGDEF)-like protein/PAS domain S-box-containing protein
MDGVYVYCNKQAEKVWQKKQTDIIGHTDEEIFGQEIAEKYRLADQKVLAEGMQSVVEEYLNVHDLDNNSWLETIKTPLLDSSSHAVGTIGMTRNVTNRKVVEEQLMLAGTVFENSVEGVIITDKSGNIAYVNKAFCDITGYSEMEAVGRNPRFLKSGRHGEDFYQTMWQAITADGKWQGEIWNRRKDGRVYPELATISVVYNEQKEICNFVAVFADISQQKHSEAILTHMAYHDPLTDLPNRLKLVAQMDSEIQRVKRYSGQFATIFIDVDHFKHINDTYGHLVGDEVLCCVAKRLSSSVRLEDTVSRIGGDEFVVLMPALMKIESVRRVVGKLMAVFNQPVKLSNGEKIRLTGSLGIALYPGDGETSETLLKNADNAMYRAKQNRNDYAYYTESLTRESENHLKLQSAIHESLEGDGFHLVYQPQVAVSTGSLIGFEALIRWNHPIHGNITPTEFIPIAESIGLIHAVGHWVLKEACLQGVRWLKEGYDFGRISVNVAGQQLQRATFVLEVQQVLNETGLGANYLELEVTESFMMRNPEQSIKYLNALKNLGIHVAIDDFGTGYSSLSYLQKLPLDKVKLDRSFVKNIPQSSHDIAIAEAVIALGKALSLTVIAEGVETKEQVAFLQERGCGQAQGYYYGYPETPEDLISLLEKNR